MMKKLTLLCGLVLVCSFSAMAQSDDSKVDIFGGYSYVRFQFPNQGLNANGGDGQITYNVSPVLGITGDFGAYHVSPTALGASGTVFTYMAGPKLTLRRDKFAPYVQAVFGGAWVGAGIEGVGSSSFNAFAMALGGGVDYRFSQRLSFRLFQADYLLTRFSAAEIGGSNNDQSNVRISTGVVFHF